jgi:hypothetical protein
MTDDEVAKALQELGLNMGMPQEKWQRQVRQVIALALKHRPKKALKITRK